MEVCGHFAGPARDKASCPNVSSMHQSGDPYDPDHPAGYGGEDRDENKKNDIRLNPGPGRRRPRAGEAGLGTRMAILVPRDPLPSVWAGDVTPHRPPGHTRGMARS